MVTNLMEYRLKRRADSLRAWWALSTFFGRCSVPVIMCPGLMFVPLEKYQTWARDSSIPAEHIRVSEKYVYLYELLRKKFERDEEVSKWFLRESFGPLFEGMSPAQSIIMKGEPQLDNTISMFESMH